MHQPVSGERKGTLFPQICLKPLPVEVQATTLNFKILGLCSSFLCCTSDVDFIAVKFSAVKVSVYMRCWECHLISRRGIALQVLLHKTDQDHLQSTLWGRGRLFFIPLTAIMEAWKEQNGNGRQLTSLERALTSSERALTGMSVFLQVCGEREPLLQTHCKAAGDWQSSPVLCYWGKPLLILNAERHLSCKCCNWPAVALDLSGFQKSTAFSFWRPWGWHYTGQHEEF